MLLFDSMRTSVSFHLSVVLDSTRVFLSASFFIKSQTEPWDTCVHVCVERAAQRVRQWERGRTRSLSAESHMAASVSMNSHQHDGR